MKLSRNTSLLFSLVSCVIWGACARSKPELRRFATLCREGFVRSPIWVQSHTIDYDEPWHDEVAEDIFRPWKGVIPIEPKIGKFLVRATFELADGSRMTGFATPAESFDLGRMQPIIFTERGGMIASWYGMV